jgi:uncharacterized membrane protein YfcA
MFPFRIWVTVFLLAWLGSLLFWDLGGQVLSHWPMALAMLFGSYVAGSTPMGGGTVGFPILVLVLDEPASLGRTFSFAIQSVGMSSASIYILCRRQALAKGMLLWSIIGSSLTLPLTLVYLLPLVDDSQVKMVFASTWLLFGLHTLLRRRALLESSSPSADRVPTPAGLGLAVGLLGGVVAGLTGVGINMLAYMALIVLLRQDLRIAVATSVLIMAYDSLLGTLVSALNGSLSEELFYHWFAAAPVVLFGAPFGAIMLQLIPRGGTMLLVAVLCILQFFWICRDVGLL